MEHLPQRMCVLTNVRSNLYRHGMLCSTDRVVVSGDASRNRLHARWPFAPVGGFKPGPLALAVESSACVSGTCVALPTTRFKDWKTVVWSLGAGRACSAGPAPEPSKTCSRDLAATWFPMGCAGPLLARCSRHGGIVAASCGLTRLGERLRRWSAITFLGWSVSGCSGAHLRERLLYSSLGASGGSGP